MDRIKTSFGFSSTAAEVAAGINLSGKRAIITGASSGIGIETARALAAAGAEVTLAVRNTEAGNATSKDIAASTGNDRIRVAHHSESERTWRLGACRHSRSSSSTGGSLYTLPDAELSIMAGPSQHFSGRGLRDRNATLWSCMIIRSPRHSVFFSGDTGLTTEYTAIRERFGPFDLIMLEVGAFHPAWGDMHLGPENALKAHALLGGGAFLPVHWGTFALAVHDWDQPAEALLALGPKNGAQLLMPRLGEPVDPAHGHEVTPWWRAVSVRESRQQPPETAVMTRFDWSHWT
jgi:Beta-lactamase superfamily domain/short chain dehydrogenase